MGELLISNGALRYKSASSLPDLHDSILELHQAAEADDFEERVWQELNEGTNG